MNEIIQTGIRCLEDEANGIRGLIPRIDQNFEEAVNLIYGCKGKVIVTGVGKSGHIAAKIAATFASTGTPSFFLNPLDAFHGDLGMVTKDDVVIAISYSGYTDELLRFIPFLLEMHIPIIGISGNPSSLLAQYSSSFLNINVEHEADPLNLAPTCSTTATLAIGDAIACALVKVRKFKVADFARFHPGGSIGKRLLSKVKDYMVSANLPVVGLDSRVCDTIIEISKTKQGIAIVEEQGKLVGVVTDGDVRRAMQTHQDVFFSLKVQEIMCTKPKTIRPDAKLSQAGDKMRKYNIHSLVVVDNDRKAVGIIDSFSCL